MTSVSRFFLLLIVVSISACGGGSGGGGNADNEAGDTSPGYTGSTAPMLINEDNAYKAASMALEGLVVHGLADSIWVYVPDPTNVVPNTETIAGNQGGELEIITSQLSPTVARLEMTFSDYLQDGILYSGVIIEKALPRTNVQSGLLYSRISGTLEFVNFSITVDGKTLILDGELESEGGNSQKMYLDVYAEDGSSGESILLENYVIDFADTGDNVFNKITYAVSGDVYQSQFGQISVATSRPIVDFQLYEPLELWSGRGNGKVDIVGDGANLQVFTLSPHVASLLLDANQDGRYERALRLEWAHINELKPFGNTNLNRPPIANSGYEITTAIDIPTTIHGLYSHDDDNQFLDFVWEQVYEPEGSNLNLGLIDQPYFTFTPVIAGDYLFRLTVSDGENSRSTGLKVEVKESLLISNITEVETSAASLEVFPLENGGLTYKIDAKSAIWYDYIVELESTRWTSNLASMHNTLEADFESTLVPEKGFSGTARVGFNSRFSYSGVKFGFNGTPFDYSVAIDGDYVESVLAVDLDGDGLKDLLLLSKDNQMISESSFEVWLANGSGGYVKAVKQSIDSRQRYLTVGDLNNDSMLDVAASSWEGVTIYSQTPEGTFSNGNSINFADQSCVGFGAPRKIGIGDFDGDGLNDLLAVHSCLSKMVVWIKNDQGGFDGELTFDLAPGTWKGVSFNDVNNDGLVDVAIGAPYGAGVGGLGKVELYISDGQQFNLLNTFNNQSLGDAPEVYLEDFTGDGRPDLIHFDGSFTHFREQLENGSFSLYDSVDLPAVLNGSVIDVADLDGDGDLDVATVSHYAVKSFINDGTNFKLSHLDSDAAITPNPDSIVAYDYNQDGNIDLIIPSSSLSIFIGGIRSISSP